MTISKSRPFNKLTNLISIIITTYYSTFHTFCVVLVSEKTEYYTSKVWIVHYGFHLLFTIIMSTKTNKPEIPEINDEDFLETILPIFKVIMMVIIASFIVGFVIYLIDVSLNSYDETEIYISDHEYQQNK